MTVYILNFLTLPIYNLLIKDRKKLVLIFTAQLFLILALRDPTVGMDLPNYSGGYAYISSLRLGELLSRLRLISTAKLVSPYAYESGYVVLNWLLSKIGIGFQGFLILHAAFCMSSFGLFIYRYSKLPWISFSMLLALSYFEYSFGILRQMLAICILLYAVPMIERKKPIPFFLLVLLAFTVHRVALIFAVLYLAYYITVTRWVYIGNAIFWVVLTALSPLIFNVLIVRILQALGKNSYTVSKFEWSHLMTILLIFAVGAFFTLDFSTMKERRNSIITWGFLLAFPIQILGMNNAVFARMVLVYLVFAIIFVPNVIAEYKKKPILAQIGAYVLWLFMFILMVLQLRSSAIVPYSTFFS